MMRVHCVHCILLKLHETIISTIINFLLNSYVIPPSTFLIPCQQLVIKTKLTHLMQHFSFSKISSFHSLLIDKSSHLNLFSFLYLLHGVMGRSWFQSNLCLIHHVLDLNLCNLPALFSNVPLASLCKIANNRN